MRKQGLKALLGLASAMAVVITVFFVGTIKVSASAPTGWEKIKDDIERADSGTTITLTEDITAENGDAALLIEDNKNITIDLNGHTLDRNLSEPTADGYVICVKDGAELTVKDSSQSGTGVITGGNNSNEIWKCTSGVLVLGTFTLESGTIKNCKSSMEKDTSGGGVGVEGGTFNMTGGCIDGCEAQSGGGVIILREDEVNGGYGTFNMTGGSIINCKAVYGGAVFIYDKSKMNLVGGEIRNNIASACGGGVYIYTDTGSLNMNGGKIVGNSAERGGGVCCQSSNFAMYGGEITENSAENCGGGLYNSSAQYDKIVLGGTAKITGNTGYNNQTDNAYLQSINIGTGGEKPTVGFNVGVTKYASGVFTNNSADEDTIYFFADDGVSIIQLTSDRKYEFVKKDKPTPDPDPDPNPNPTPGNNGRYYTPLENEIIASESGTIKWSEGDSLPYSVLKELANKPSVTVEFTFKYQGVEYTVVIDSQTAARILDEKIPWFGPAKLLSIRSGNAGGAGYVVKEGDTLDMIAAANHTTVAAILKLNPSIKNPNLIFPGDRIVLP